MSVRVASPPFDFFRFSSAAQRRRNRRAQAHSSRENLVKDSSSDVSPRDSAAPSLAERRRQRRRQASAEDQQHVNPAFAADDEPVLPPTAEQSNDDEEEEEQQKVRDADRLTSHVEKEHSRKINELRQQTRPAAASRASPSEPENEQDDVEAQLRAQQKSAARKIDKADVDDTAPVEPISIPTTTGRERSLDKVLERARRARGAATQDDGQSFSFVLSSISTFVVLPEMQSTMGSSRRFGGTTDPRLQKILRGYDPSMDPGQTGSMPRGDRSTRFDRDEYDPRDEARIREEIDQKQGVRRFRSILVGILSLLPLGTIETLARGDEQVGNGRHALRSR